MVWCVNYWKIWAFFVYGVYAAKYYILLADEGIFVCLCIFYTASFNCLMCWWLTDVDAGEWDDSEDTPTRLMQYTIPLAGGLGMLFPVIQFIVSLYMYMILIPYMYQWFFRTKIDESLRAFYACSKWAIVCVLCLFFVVLLIINSRYGFLPFSSFLNMLYIYIYIPPFALKYLYADAILLMCKARRQKYHMERISMFVYAIV